MHQTPALSMYLPDIDAIFVSPIVRQRQQGNDQHSRYENAMKQAKLKDKNQNSTGESYVWSDT